MGGYGSTRWGWHSKKWTVEDCRKLSIFDLYGRIIPKRFFVEQQETTGSVKWTNIHTGQRVADIGYSLRFEDQPHLWLFYSYNDQRKGYAVPLETSPRHFGGVMWWFICPGQNCGRRCAKLYLRRGLFLCRECQELTYTSCQESHQYDRMGGEMGGLMNRLDRVLKAEKVREQLHNTRPGSKRYLTLLDRYRKLV